MFHGPSLSMLNAKKISVSSPGYISTVSFEIKSFDEVRIHLPGTIELFLCKQSESRGDLPNCIKIKDIIITPITRNKIIKKVITQYKPRDYIQLILGQDHQKDLGHDGYTGTPIL